MPAPGFANVQVGAAVRAVAIFAIVLGGLPVAPVAAAEPDRWEPGRRIVRALQPDYLLTEHGGYVGFLTLGAGWEVARWYHLELVAGYVPGFAAGGTRVWQGTLKQEFRPLPTLRLPLQGRSPLRVEVLRLGVSAIWSPSQRLWLVWPRKYPQTLYYPWPTALRLAPYVGLALGWQRHEVFAEYTALDRQLVQHWSNRQYLQAGDWLEIGSYGVGYRLQF